MGLFEKPQKQVIEVVHKYEDNRGCGCAGCLGWIIGIFVVLAILVAIFG